MESAPARNKEKRGSGLSQAAASLSGGLKASLSRSEEFLTRVSAELTDEALFTAGYHMNREPTKERQTQDQGTQIFKHGDPPTSGPLCPGTLSNNSSSSS